ncbi:MAG: glutathione S-transferase N-terminal domain-containing protein [Gammaproteobacteria bacterium]|jgi:RNA polymerase-associated protein|nr:glutathione S-transferase N-terminal domain-containing protein [Gammaproteobacteria bacterium]
MTLYASPNAIPSHRTRIVLAEKGIGIDIINVDGPDLPEDLLDLNPYHSVPTLVDRGLVLYDSRVIMEYIDERFPHPPLMPVDPVSRAQVRLALYRVERDWYGMVEQIQAASDRKQLAQARKVLQESLLSSAEIFAAKRYFLNDEFTLVDASISPVLWRLPALGIELDGNAAQPIRKYMDRIFASRSFRESLTEAEREMRQ